MSECMCGEILGIHYKFRLRYTHTKLMAFIQSTNCSLILGNTNIFPKRKKKKKKKFTFCLLIKILKYIVQNLGAYIECSVTFYSLISFVESLYFATHQLQTTFQPVKILKLNAKTHILNGNRLPNCIFNVWQHICNENLNL